MRWNQFGDDIARATALGEVLLGAALAAGASCATKLASARGQVAKSLGTSTLPVEVSAHLRRFDPRRFDLGAACRVVALEGRDRLDLMKAVSVVIRADGTVAPEERAYALRVATQLGLSWTEVLDLVGVPARATTNTQPRPVTRP